MGLFDDPGFGAIREPGETFGTRRGMANYAQIELIRALFAEGSGTPEADGLGTWLHHKFHVSSLRFLNARDAGKAITALKAMTARRCA